MNIEEEFKRFEFYQKNDGDCDLINKILENDTFNQELFKFITLNIVMGVSSSHAITHLLVDFFRYGYNCAKSEKAISELKDLYEKE